MCPWAWEFESSLPHQCIVDWKTVIRFKVTGGGFSVFTPTFTPIRSGSGQRFVPSAHGVGHENRQNVGVNVCRRTKWGMAQYLLNDSERHALP